MELGYPDNYSEDMVNLQEDDGSTYDGNIDLNLAVNKEEREVHGAENEAWDKTQVELDEQAQHGSPSLLADLEHERLKSPNERSDSQVYSKLDHDEEKLKEFDFDQERSYSYLGETEMGSGKFEGGLYNEFKGGEKHPSEMDSMGQQSNMMEDNSPHHEEYDDSGRISENLQNEKTESVYDVMERGGTESLMGKTYDGNGTEEGDINYSGKSPSVYEKVAGSSDVHPTGSRGRSSSPLREMSRSPERALEIQGDADRKQPLSPHGHDFPYSSPRMSRQKFSPSPQRNGGHGKRDIPEDHPSLYTRRTSDSPARRSRRDSPRRDNSVLKSTSPRRRHLSPDRRRDERSVSRSPPRRRDLSSGYRRDYRDRSRSRSPNAADRYRRSPRRYSPRRRSPPGYHSRHRSPRRRPWSPPRN